MKKSSIIWGIVLIVIGVILGLNSLGICDVNIFFNGWWTLFIIVPSFIGLFTDDNKSGSIITLIIGVLLLLACQDIIGFDLLIKLIPPLVIVLIGMSLVFSNLFNKKINERIKTINGKTDSKKDYCATFSGQNIKFDNEEFTGTTINAIFGGVKLDLRDAIIKEDAVINASAIFGGIDIFVPDDVSVKIKSNSIFGGVDNKKKTKIDKKNKNNTVYIDATCLFGGVEIK